METMGQMLRAEAGPGKLRKPGKPGNSAVARKNGVRALRAWKALAQSQVFDAKLAALAASHSAEAKRPGAGARSCGAA